MSWPRRPLSAAEASIASTPARGIGKRWIGATLGIASSEASIGWGLCAISNPELPQTEAELAQYYQDRIMETQQKHLEPLREDLADWLNRIFGLSHLNSDSFINNLEDGVLVCKLARLLQEKAKEILDSVQENGDDALPDIARSRRLSSEESKISAARQVPMKKIKCWERAPKKSFFSRENACNFIEFCRKLGIHESVLFESEGLVLQTQPRNVILCLLDVGRKAARLGMDAPALVHLERDIDRQLYERGEDEDLLGELAQSRSQAGSRGPASPVLVHDGEFTELDRKVEELAIASQSECRCVAEHCARLQIRKISEGLYFVAGRNVFIRLLKDRHVMVRVGGGWDTLEHFLIRHDPCRGGSNYNARSRSPTPDTNRVAPRTTQSAESNRTKSSYIRSPSAPSKIGSTPCLIDLSSLSPAVTPRRVLPVRRAQTARLAVRTEDNKITETKRSLGDLSQAVSRLAEGKPRIKERPTSLLDVSRRGNSTPSTPVGGALPPRPLSTIERKVGVGRTASFHFGTNRQTLSKPLAPNLNLDALNIKNSKKTLSNNSINELDLRPRWK